MQSLAQSKCVYEYYLECRKSQGTAHNRKELQFSSTVSEPLFFEDDVNKSNMLIFPPSKNILSPSSQLGLLLFSQLN